MTKSAFTVAASVLLLTLAAPAQAWTVNSLITHPCHEDITATALARVRADPSVAPHVAHLDAVTRDDRALLADLPFSLDENSGDLAAAALLIGVRSNDLKGNDALDSVDLVEITSDPTLQREHCLRTDVEDEPNGTVEAVADCRAYIAQRFTQALAGLDSNGDVDAASRTTLPVALAVRGAQTPVSLPQFYVFMGQAMHALEDSFAHAIRTTDAMTVTTTLNWIDYADQRLMESRDGPAHSMALDDCTAQDMVRRQTLARAEDAATELLQAALVGDGADPQVALDAVLDRYLGVQPGCTEANQYCNPAENAVRLSGCSCAIGRSAGPERRPLLALALVTILFVSLLRRRRVAAVLIFLLLGGVAQADPSPSPDPSPLIAPPGSHQIEPGRQEPTPTRAELESIRQKKKLGSRVGLYVAFGGAIDRPALATIVGLRLRITERWLVGLDAEWNPFVSSSTGVRPGVVNIAATGIWRYPLTWQRVNLRISASLGTSVQLFDVYGAERGSVGLFAGVSLLGVDIDLGHHLRVVIDPTNIAVAAPHLTGFPFYYVQYRLTIGLQWGS